MIGFYGLPLNHLQLFLDQVQALTTEDIRAAFARHFDPEQRLVITVGPAMVVQDTAPAEPEAAAPDAETNVIPEPEV